MYKEDPEKAPYPVSVSPHYIPHQGNNNKWVEPLRMPGPYIHSYDSPGRGKRKREREREREKNKKQKAIGDLRRAEPQRHVIGGPGPWEGRMMRVELD